jgi:hypothetical protein
LPTWLRKSLNNKPFFDRTSEFASAVLSQTPTTVSAEKLPAFFWGTPADFFERRRAANFFCSFEGIFGAEYL